MVGFGTKIVLGNLKKIDTAMPKDEFTRRCILAGACAIGLAGTAHAEMVNDGELSVSAAHRAAASGRITLIDIRRPDEWNATGSGEHAHRLDMRRRDFLGQLDRLVGFDRAKPIALICASGVRTKWLARQLRTAGYSQIIDVPEGMMGSAAGPGWLRTGLPVVR